MPYKMSAAQRNKSLAGYRLEQNIRRRRMNEISSIGLRN